MMKITSALFAVAIACAAARTAHAEWFANTGLSVVFDDNLDHAVNKEDRKNDIAAVPSITFGQYLQVGDATRLTMSIDLRDTEYSRYQGLNNLAAGLTASLRYKAGLGSYVPWVQIYGSEVYLDYREDDRDGSLSSVGLDAGKRLNDRLFARLGYAYESTHANVPAFDTRNGALSVQADVLMTESMQLTLGYAVGSGLFDIYGPLLPGTYASLPRALVVNTFQSPMQVYPMQANFQTASVFVNAVFDRHWTAEIGGEHSQIRAAGRRYPDTLFRATVSYAY